MDALSAAIDGPVATKERLFAWKEGAFTAKGVSIARITGHIAVKNRDFERSRVAFAVIEVEHAAMRGLNTAKGLCFAVIGVH
jgi:hypothetical protein